MNHAEFDLNSIFDERVTKSATMEPILRLKENTGKDYSFLSPDWIQSYLHPFPRDSSFTILQMMPAKPKKILNTSMPKIRKPSDDILL